MVSPHHSKCPVFSIFQVSFHLYTDDISFKIFRQRNCGTSERESDISSTGQHICIRKLAIKADDTTKLIPKKHWTHSPKKQQLPSGTCMGLTDHAAHIATTPRPPSVQNPSICVFLCNWIPFLCQQTVF